MLQNYKKKCQFTKKDTFKALNSIQLRNNNNFLFIYFIIKFDCFKRESVYFREPEIFAKSDSVSNFYFEKKKKFMVIKKKSI